MRGIEEKRIVIVGAGFGGLTTALTLAKDPAIIHRGYDIVLVDRSSYHLYTAGLYEVAAVPRHFARDEYLAASVRIPLSEIIRARAVRFVQGALTGLDMSRRHIMLDNKGTLSYDFLVLALGAETNYFDIHGLKEYSMPLKTADDAVLLRNKIESIAEIKPSLSIVIGGAGATGVELAAELINFLCVIEREKNPAAPVCRTSVCLLEAGLEILPGFDANTVRRIRQRLESLGVMIKTGIPIIAASKNDITLKSGERVPYDILVWTGGIKGAHTLKSLGLTLSPKGTLVVDDYLRVPQGDGRIFAIGDNAWLAHPRTKRPLPATAQVAEQEARHAARAISRVIRGASLRRFCPMHTYPFVLAVGRKYAFADLITVRLTGMSGWCIKQLVQLKYFLFILPWPRALKLWWRNMRLYHSND
ncbi:MAG: NAD(P)/FAD-dependent oxidoreductase [Patescibacteria group bacterium]